MTNFKMHEETMKELGHTIEVIHEDSWSFYTVEYKEYSFGFGTPVFYRWWKNDGRKVKNQRRFRTVKQSSKGTYVTLDGVRVYFEMKSQQVEEVKSCMMCGNTNQDEVVDIELFSNEEGEDTVELQHICSEDMGCNAPEVIESEEVIDVKLGFGGAWVVTATKDDVTRTIAIVDSEEKAYSYMKGKEKQIKIGQMVGVELMDKTGKVVGFSEDGSRVHVLFLDGSEWAICKKEVTVK